jgi:hypothetical protein
MTTTQLPTTSAATAPTVVPAAGRIRVRGTAAALVLAGAGFAIYPALRPFTDETTLAGAAAYASTRWLVAHTTAMIAFLLLGLGLHGVVARLRDTAAGRPAQRGLLTSWIGIGLTLPYYGAETFGLHSIGQQALARHDATLLTSLTDGVRWHEGLWFILPGLLALAMGTAMIAVAAHRSGLLGRAGMLLAAGFALYIPQYATGQSIRVAHGVLLTAGCVWLATALLRRSAGQR